jgi:hypothetical protein
VHVDELGPAQRARLKVKVVMATPTPAVGDAYTDGTDPARYAPLPFPPLPCPALPCLHPIGALDAARAVYAMRMMQHVPTHRGPIVGPFMIHLLLRAAQGGGAGGKICAGAHQSACGGRPGPCLRAGRLA